MKRDHASTPERARSQWQKLHDTLVGLGVSIERLTPQPGCPTWSYRQRGLVFQQRFFSARFRHEVRARETPYDDAWFAAHGTPLRPCPEGVYFEGAGDALFCGPTLFAGYRIRSDALGPSVARPDARSIVLPLELVNPYFTTSIHAFVRWRPGWRSIIPKPSIRTAARSLAAHVPAFSRWKRRKPTALAVMPW